MGSTTRLGVLNESLDVARGRIPKDDADEKTGVLDGVRDDGGPEVKHYNRCIKLLEPLARFNFTRCRSV